MKNEMSNASILLVIDPSENLHVLTQIFSKQGFTIQIAKNGSETISAVSSTQPDLIFLGIKLPDYSGFELCRKLKANNQIQNIPVIFISELNRAEDKRKAFECGAIDYIAGPFNEQEILVKVKANVENRVTQHKLGKIAEELTQQNENLRKENQLREQAEKQIESGHSRVKMQRNVLAEIAGKTVFTNVENEEGFHFLTRKAAEALQVQRASIWLFTEDKTQLRCLSLFDRLDKTSSSGAVLKSENYPNYFKAILEKTRIYANDAQMNPLTSEFTKDYLIPLGITSMLDAGIFAGGQLTGVLCAEHCGEKREWNADEEAFSGTFAAIIAQLLENNERKRLEAALTAEKKLFEITLKSIGDAVISTDLKGRITFMNKVAEQLTGWKFSEAQAKPLTEVFYIINQKTRKVCKNPVERVLQTGEIIGLANHTALISKDKKEFIISDSGSPIKDEEGNIIGTVLVFNDDTEKHYASEKIESFNQIFQESLNEIYIFDAQTLQFVFANKGALNNIGYLLDELTEMTPVDIKPEFDLLSFKKELQPLISGTSDTLLFETTHLRKDGTAYQVEVHLQKSTFDNRQVYVAIILDITKRKKAEKKLIQNEKNLRESQRIARIGSWYLDIASNEVTWTEELYKMYGFDPKQPPPSYTEHQKLFTPESWELLSTSLAKTSKTGIPYELELKTVRADGSNGWMWVRGETIENAAGEVIGLWGAAQDISIQKEIQEQLIQARKIAEQNELRYKTVVSNTPIVTFVLDANGTFTLSEGRGLKKLGLQPGQVVGISAFDFYNDFPSIQKDIQNVLEGNSFRSQTILPNLVFDVSYTPTFDQNGKVSGAIGVANDITEQHQAHEMLLKSQSEYADLYENSPDMFFSMEPENTTIIQCNKTLAKITGYSKKELIGKPLAELYHPDCHDEFNFFLNQFHKTGKVNNAELEVVKKDGTTLNVLLNTIATYNKEGKIIHSRSVWRDITKSILAEKELQKLSQAIEQSPSVFALTDTEGNIEYVNPQFTKLTGYTQQEVVKQSSNILRSGNEKKDVYQELWKAISAGKVWTGEFQNKKKNGTLYWESATVSPVFNEKNEIINFMKLAVDITEQKRFEDTQKLLLEIAQLSTEHFSLHSFLAEVHEKLKNIVRAENFYVGLHNDKDNLFSFPYHSDEFDKIPLNTPIDFSGGYTDYVLKTNQSLIITPDYQNEIEEKGIVKGYGDELSVWLGVPFKTGSGDKPNGVIAIQDYQNTETYTEVDKTIMEILAHSIGSFIERIRFLQELIIEKEKAEESDRLKSAFMANMSHEIRTPMNGILGFTELLLTPELTSEEKESYIQIVHQSGQRMLDTVSDIVEISKIEAGMVSVNVDDTNINDRVDDLIQFFKPEAAKKGIVLTLDAKLPDEISTVSTDRNKFDSILTNLIKNAIKYTDSGAINVGCKLKKSAIEFYVKDTGIGIPTNRQHAIFNRFEQADIGDTRAFEGSGLGLAIIKSYLEMLNGKIWLESVSGVGSTFSFTIPCNFNALNDLADIPKQKEEEENQTVNDLKILIAEDDENSVLYISAIIKELSKEIVVARNGKDAVEICRNQPDIDLVLMDIQMPKLNGHKATKEIKKFNPEIVIIAQTAFAMIEDEQKAINSGCDDYISKPINKNILHQKIKTIFNKN